MRGFSIIHALISLVIFASVTIGGLKWQRFNASVDKGRNIGQQYLTLNAAVNNYIVTYYQALSKLNPKCSAMAFTTVDPATPSWAQNNPNQCTLTIAAGKTVANGFQPSPAELITLGLLPLSPPTPAFPAKSAGLLQIESPDLPTAALVYEYIPRAVTPSAISQPRLFINIEMVCVQRGSATNPNTGNAVPTAPGANGCDSATTTTALKTLIFNTQPYNANQSNYSFTFPALLGSVFNTLGDDAVSSGMVDVKLVNTNNALNGKNFQLTHPIKGGPSGILGLRGGYGASYAMQHSRVDGSNPPTADWDFGGHGITSGLSKLKLPVQVLGTACDIKEDIALDATANLLVCRNSIWSTFSTANAGTIDIREYLRLYVQLYPGYSSTNELLNLNYYKNYDQFVSQTTLPNSNITRHNIPYFFNPSTIVCAQITTNVETSKWYPELIEHEEPNVFYKFSVNQEDISPFYQLTVCAPAPDRLYFRSFRFNKINK
jgi:hypothetical protein